MRNFVAGLLFIFAFIALSLTARADSRALPLNKVQKMHEEWFNHLKVTSAWDNCAKNLSVADTPEGRKVVLSFSYVEEDNVIFSSTFTPVAKLEITTDVDLFEPEVVIGDDNLPRGLVMNIVDKIVVEDCLGKRAER